MKYTYIFAPKNAQNEAVFEQFTKLFPELLEQGRVRVDIWSKSENDIITPNPFPFEPATIDHAGKLFLMIKAVTDAFTPEMLDNVIAPQTFTDTTEIKAKFWIWI